MFGVQLATRLDLITYNKVSLLIETSHSYMLSLSILMFYHLYVIIVNKNVPIQHNSLIKLLKESFFKKRREKKRVSFIDSRSKKLKDIYYVYI